MTTNELLDTYFQGLMKKSGWEPLIANDFVFLGGRNMTEPPVVGKAAYLQVVMEKFYPCSRPCALKTRWWTEIAHMSSPTTIFRSRTGRK